MLRVLVGHSNDPDSLFAIKEILGQCASSLEGEVPKAGILLAGIDFDYQLILQQINEAFPGIELIGCTTDGEISSVLEFQQDSLTLLLFCSNEIEIRAGIGRDISKNPVAAARQAVEEAKAKTLGDLKLCLTTPESINVNGDFILDGLKQALGQEFPILGGGAGDGGKLKKTYQFFQTEVLTDSVPILLFSGDLLFSHGVASGWHPISKKCRVTKATTDVVYEIDGKPALDFYQYYLGDRFTHIIEYPLAVFEPEGDTFCIRAPYICDEELRSIRFFGNVPPQAVVQIAETSREAILLACKESIGQALDSYPGEEPDAALFFSCMALRYILGTRTKEEYQIVKDCFTKPVPIFGFYSYNEISPLFQGSQTRLHNESFVTLLLGRR
jgi:hypothetical protein